MPSQQLNQQPGKRKHLPTANEIIEEQTSLDLGLPLSLIKEVVAAQEQYTEFKIREGALEGVMWPRLGKVRIKVSKIHAMHEDIGNKDVIKNTEIR